MISNVFRHHIEYRVVPMGAVDPVFAKEVALIYNKRQSELSLEQR